MVLEVSCFRDALRPGKFRPKDPIASQRKITTAVRPKILSDGDSQFPKKPFFKLTEIQYYITC